MLTDFPLVDVYRDLAITVILYVFAGSVGWGLAFLVSRLAGKKGETFFLKQAAQLAALSIGLIYGVWAVLRRAVFSLEGALLTISFILAAFFLEKFVSSRIKKRCVTAFLCATFSLPLFLRFFPQPVALAKATRPNIILLSVDTVRPDHLGCFGYSKNQTPHIDRIASEGLRFTNAYTPIPLTAPSFGSILTGLYPKTHGSRQNLTFLDPSATTLAEVLSRNGYHTAAFVSGYPLKRYLCGLAKGFDLYQDRFSFFDGFKLFRFLERWGCAELQLERRAGEVSRLSIPWMHRYRKGPFFAWIHYYDPHVPYHPPLSSESAFLRRLRDNQREYWGKTKKELPPGVLEGMTALYDGEIRYVDQDIGRILSFLDREGLREKTLLLFVSDHGESFDHDYYFDHGDRLYESCTHVPLIVSYPGVLPKNQVSAELVQTVDFFPTILALLKLDATGGEGRNLFENGIVRHQERLAYAELSRREKYPSLGALWAIRRGPWKLIYSPEGRPDELYHLSEDPDERVNLASQKPEVLQPMKEELIRWMGAQRKAPRIPIGGLSREKLKSLGYLQ